MPKTHDKSHVAPVFVKFAAGDEGGVVVKSSSDARLCTQRNNRFPDYDSACDTLSKRLSRRRNPPSALVCEMVH